MSWRYRFCFYLGSGKGSPLCRMSHNDLRTDQQTGHSNPIPPSLQILMIFVPKQKKKKKQEADLDLKPTCWSNKELDIFAETGCNVCQSLYSTKHILEHCWPSELATTSAERLASISAKVTAKATLPLDTHQECSSVPCGTKTLKCALKTLGLSGSETKPQGQGYCEVRREKHPSWTISV